MRIGYLRDEDTAIIGGAELSADAIVAAAPEGVEMLYVPPGEEPAQPCDAFLVFNCAFYPPETVQIFQGKPVIKKVADFWPHGDDSLRAWLLEFSRRVVFFSKMHYEHFPYNIGTKVSLCPSPVDTARFRRAGQESKKRSGVFWMAQTWVHKGLQEAVVWAENSKTRVDFYGEGPLRPRESQYCHYAGQVPYNVVPYVMAQYEAFIHVPSWHEPYGRTVIEAWAAGCKLIVNHNIGALWWLENDQDAVHDGAGRFWRIIEEAV